MKQLSAVLLFIATLGAQAQTITSMSNFTWSPSTLTITAGQTINFVVTGNHHAREVSQATWNANGTTSNGGFDFLAGTSPLTLTIPGTYYYVCVPHVGSGMKGTITVETGTGVVEQTAPQPFTVGPNPASDHVTVTSSVTQGTLLSVIDASGREVLAQRLTGTDRIGVESLPVGNYTALLRDTEGIIRSRQHLTIQR